MNTFIKPVVFIGFAFLCGVSCNQMKTSHPLENYRIIYNVGYDVENDNYEIFSMNYDGTDKQNITNSKSIEWAYLTYKDRIFFLSDRDLGHRKFSLYEMNANGEDLKRITDYPLHDSWMGIRNEGKELVVAVDLGNGKSQLRIIDRQGNLIENITNDTLHTYNSPLFSPDGSIVFYRSFEGLKKDSSTVDELYSIELSTKKVKQLTYYPSNDTTAQWYEYKAGPPMWVPNSDQISYISKQNGRYGIFVLSSNGGEPKRITPNHVNYGWHSWSEDGRWRIGELWDEKELDWAVYIKDSVSGSLDLLTHEYKYEQAPLFVLKP